LKKVALLILVLLSGPIAYASSEGPLYPGSVVNDPSNGGTAWTNPGNASAEDGAVANEALSSSQYLKATSYGFSSIGDTDIVDGIVLEVKKGTLSCDVVIDNGTFLYVAGVKSGTDHEDSFHDWSCTLTWATYGSPTDTWGLSLTGADVKDPNFGSAFAEIKDDGGAQHADVDAHRMTVYYHAATPAAPTIKQGFNFQDYY
jgi:hypothetical protein